jgi:hypothetical protein
MTTAQTIFELTMSLMDELSESGSADTSDTKEYKNRTLSILNILRGELYPYSDTYETNDNNERPIAVEIENFTDNIYLDDYICQSVMPYGLAAHLLLDENPSAASYYQQRYDELKATLTRGLPQSSEDIEDVYGSGYFPYNEFACW